jgi:hypothetical protein
VEGSWMYVDVFNGGTELSEDDLRWVVGWPGQKSDAGRSCAAAAVVSPAWVCGGQQGAWG